ncbi:hypothetical protein SODALDRAFT_311446 [Sodiomyces alkalinus F11]|uniref:Uncharacterized protein n=1 Tax=Sodiomyces alkalinus (strain CBS 110278 / VKM F-3762 / F11) TaxID=1314773 RepID=A0A3N2PVU1_SODAK|nr:hypothetical protein SODALDRAFT_311446 [Sodiomyces alkalinus F11]ROT38594.1 hypothetical protein SODALDRAFT_311446 [Sodiomyces alkalinus F11]
MLPPVDESVLQNNPEFASLYHTLTTAILNPDGSTKNDTLRKEREAVREELRTHRLNHAKQHLLSHAIATATPPEPKVPGSTISQQRPKTQQQQKQQAELPEPLLDLLFLLPPLLDPSSRPLSSEETSALLSTPPLSDLPTLLPQLAPIIASSLRDSAISLARVAHPATNPSFLHRTIPHLARDVADRLQALDAAREALVRERLALTRDVVALLRKYAEALALLIRALEGKHGVMARSVELGAAEVAAEAKKAELEARIVEGAVRADVYTPEAVRALRNYEAHLRDATLRVEESIRGLERELERYGVGVEGAEGREGRMREMARVKREMEREVEEVRRDLERLERA